MDKKEAFERSANLLKRSKTVHVGSVGPCGFPYIKAMLNLEPESLARVWLSTNTSTKRVAQFRENPNACLYYSDENNFEGLLLIGKINVRQDLESKKKLWREGFEIYYPKGINDEDYSVFEFNADTANFYHNLENVTFDPSEAL